MASPFLLLQCIARGVLKNIGNLVGLGVGGDILVETWENWQKDTQEQQRRAELQRLAQATADEIRAEVARILEREAGELSDSNRQQVSAYLHHVPALIRRNLRRPTDPTGTTIPSGLQLRKSDDLRPFLPTKLSRFKPGDRPIAGVDWELVELLGVGGFGEVWKARNPLFDGVPAAALKFCLDPEARDRLLKHEAAVLNQVMRQGRHEGIVQLQQSYLSADPPCLAYEFVDGCDLAGLIHEWRQTRGELSPRESAKVVQRLAEIVGFAHSLNPPIVHRDLKPANILVHPRADGSHAFKVADFGIGGLAIQHAIEQTTRAGQPGDFLLSTMHGSYTPLYASPQQMRGETPDPRDDVYALGVIWYQILTGDLSRGCPTGRAWQRRLTEQGMAEGLLDLMASCFEEDKADRPASAAVLADNLARVLQDGAATVPVSPPPQTDPSARAGSNTLINSIGMEFARIPAGTFLMGAAGNETETDADELPQHEVTISKPFHMGMYLVTQAQYEAVMGSNPSYFKGGWFRGGGPDHPVERVTWENALAFCKQLSNLPEEKKAGRAYRLPTEAEWEYACRAGTQTFFHHGDAISSTQANFDGNYPYREAPKGPFLKCTTKVGSYKPNAFGLYDMHGNVWEWVADWYDARYYRTSPAVDPQGPPEGEDHILRGGCWDDDSHYCRASYRRSTAPHSRHEDDYIGLRVVCEVRPVAT